MIDRTKRAEEPVRRYVAGFLFRARNHAMKQVLLVRKTHPKWQEDLVNAVGGEIEGTESAMEAMVREFGEEANYVTNGWQFFCAEYGPGYEVFFFRHTLTQQGMLTYEAPAENDKKEELRWFDAYGPRVPMIGNLNWLLPLALDPRPIDCIVRTTGDIRKERTW